MATALMLVAGGVSYRVVAAKLQVVASERIILDPPLSAFSLEVGAWHGKDVPLAPSIVRIAGSDDYLSRYYVNAETGESASLYVNYTAKPRNMLGHRPEVCYPAVGWIHERTTSTEVTAPNVQFPCLIHIFCEPGITERRQVVLSYYVLNGELTIKERDFRTIRWRDPNLRRDAARYVAQVQVAVAVRSNPEAAERTAKRFAAVSVEGLLCLLPGANDTVAEARGSS